MGRSPPFRGGAHFERRDPRRGAECGCCRHGDSGVADRLSGHGMHDFRCDDRLPQEVYRLEWRLHFMNPGQGGGILRRRAGGVNEFQTGEQAPGASVKRGPRWLRVRSAPFSPSPLQSVGIWLAAIRRRKHESPKSPKEWTRPKGLRGFLSALQAGSWGGMGGGIKPDSSGRWETLSQLSDGHSPK